MGGIHKEFYTVALGQRSEIDTRQYSTIQRIYDAALNWKRSCARRRAANQMRSERSRFLLTQ